MIEDDLGSNFSSADKELGACLPDLTQSAVRAP